MIYSVIAARDGDVYHDEVEANSQEEAETKAREQLAEAWDMQSLLENARSDGDESEFDAEFDGFAVDPQLREEFDNHGSPDGVTPADPEQMNERRAGWAEQALIAFQEATGTDDCDAVSDLLCDLFHLLDREPERFGKSFRQLLERAHRSYLEETLDDADLAEAAAGDTCTACERDSLDCSRNPCAAVIADREA